MDIVIEALSKHPECTPLVADWHWSEWGHTDPGGSLDGWIAGLARQAGADQIPGTLLALAAGDPVGAVCLVEQDMPGFPVVAGLGPWVKGLYVRPSARRQGVATLLMQRCESWAASLGHDIVYLFTERGSGAEILYRSLGWQPFTTGHYEDIDAVVMRRPPRTQAQG